MGATIGADAKALVDYAVMGEAMARSLFGLEHPSVGLLNVGVEEVKGLEEIKQAGHMLKQLDLPMRYHGFVEGDDIGRGTVDVVVTEGFTGNIALKTAEGTAKQIGDYLRQAMQSSFFTRLGYLLAKEAFDTLKAKMDPSNVNGGVFLGLNGIVIKSHGGTTPSGFASAIDVALDMVENDLLDKINQDMALYRAALATMTPTEQDKA
jgi:glycerol-3-phosphate acyltransferase PlsX